MSQDEEEAPPSVTFATGGISWTRVRVPRVLANVGKVLIGIGALSTALVALASAFGAGFYVSFFGWPLLAISYILSMTELSGAGSLEIYPRYLTVRSTRVEMIPRASIVGALVVERIKGRKSVEIELERGDRLTVHVVDPAAAEDIVTSLGFGPRGKRVRMAMSRPTERLLHLPYAMAAVGIAMSVTMPLAFAVGNVGWEVLLAMWPALSFVFYEIVRRALRGPVVTVGDDVVRVNRGFRTREAPLDGAFAAEIRGSFLDLPRRAAILELAAARAASRGTAPVERAAAVERAGAPVAEWRARIQGALEGGSYRGTPLTTDDALAILRAAGASPEQRVGAAIALRVGGRPEAVRAAADATVDDRVRVALEAVAEGDDEEVEDAMRRLA